jgi:CRISPR-associated protein Cmr4
MPNNTLLYLHAITSLHPGSGTALGVVDLPIQRERHTGWPIVPGSSIKGVLRDACRRKASDDPLLETAFGPARIESGSEAAFAGALSLTDARILAFPVRSLKGVFAWVTCPQALRRWERDAALANLAVVLPELTLREGKALAAPGTTLLASGKIVLEEFVFEHLPVSHSLFPALPQEDRSRVVVLDDSDFTYFVRHATEVTARIKLNHDTKTVDKGALFYQEFLPAETLLYSVVLGSASHKPNDGSSASAMLQYLFQQLPEHIQIGGDETTGKGICRIVRGGA